jgi:hypothetical protein
MTAHNSDDAKSRQLIVIAPKLGISVRLPDHHNTRQFARSENFVPAAKSILPNVAWLVLLSVGKVSLSVYSR